MNRSTQLLADELLPFMKSFTERFKDGDVGFTAISDDTVGEIIVKLKNLHSDFNVDEIDERELQDYIAENTFTDPNDTALMKQSAENTKQFLQDVENEKWVD